MSEIYFGCTPANEDRIMYYYLLGMKFDRDTEEEQMKEVRKKFSDTVIDDLIFELIIFTLKEELKESMEGLTYWEVFPLVNEFKWELYKKLLALSIAKKKRS